MDELVNLTTVVPGEKKLPLSCTFSSLQKTLYSAFCSRVNSVVPDEIVLSSFLYLVLSIRTSKPPFSGLMKVVTAGTAERTVKGSALCILDELPYTGLGKFGAPFLGKFQVCSVPGRALGC